MTLKDVEELLRLVKRRGIPIWLDGGWGVDALIGTQTRRHDDLDIVVEQRHLAGLRTLMTKNGFGELAGGSPWNFVLSDPNGRQIDVHVIRLDEMGNGLYGPDGLSYPAGSLDGVGTMAGVRVRCKSAEQQMADRVGYTWTEDDRHDVRVLHDRLGVRIPAEYEGGLGHA